MNSDTNGHRRTTNGNDFDLRLTVCVRQCPSVSFHQTIAVAAPPSLVGIAHASVFHDRPRHRQARRQGARPRRDLHSGGVAYELAIPLGVYETLPRVGEQVELHTHLVVREDGWLLFGFATLNEKRVFQRLLTANGVGPVARARAACRRSPRSASCARFASRTSRRCRACRAWARKRRSGSCSISRTSSTTWRARRRRRGRARRGRERGGRDPRAGVARLRDGGRREGRARRDRYRGGEALRAGAHSRGAGEDRRSLSGIFASAGRGAGVVASSVRRATSSMTTARRTNTFTESVIREMTRIANEHGALNLAQGMPDFPMPQADEGRGVHGDPRRHQPVRDHVGHALARLAIAEKYRRWYGMEVDPERNVTVTCGATEAMASGVSRARESGRRGDRVRAVLRELRPRCDSRRSDAGVRAARAARLDDRRGQAARGVHEQDEGDHRQHAAQSDRTRVHARRDLADRGAVREARCIRVHG